MSPQQLCLQKYKLTKDFSRVLIHAGDMYEKNQTYNLNQAE